MTLPYPFSRFTPSFLRQHKGAGCPRRISGLSEYKHLQCDNRTTSPYTYSSRIANPTELEEGSWLAGELLSFNLSLSTPMDAMNLIARQQRSYARVYIAKQEINPHFLHFLHLVWCRKCKKCGIKRAYNNYIYARIITRRLHRIPRKIPTILRNFYFFL